MRNSFKAFIVLQMLCGICQEFQIRFFTILDRQSIVTNVENEWERLSKTRKFTNNCSIRPEIDIAILRTCASSVFL